jgi:hypothetical protein
MIRESGRAVATVKIESNTNALQVTILSVRRRLLQQLAVVKTKICQADKIGVGVGRLNIFE